MFFWRNNFLAYSIEYWSKQKFALVSFLLTTIIFTSCVSRTETYRGYFPIDSLVAGQINYLPTVKASVKKTARLNNQSDENKLTPDTTGWKNELGIFRELELINKSIHKNAYTVEDGLADSKSNLKVMAITCKENLPVKYLRVYYQDAHDNIRKIEAQLDEVNALYKSSRLLTMEFQETHHKIVLTSYLIQGGQKMFLGDTVSYDITGVVSLPN